LRPLVEPTSSTKGHEDRSFEQELTEVPEELVFHPDIGTKIAVAFTLATHTGNNSVKTGTHLFAICAISLFKIPFFATSC